MIYPDWLGTDDVYDKRKPAAAVVAQIASHGSKIIIKAYKSHQMPAVVTAQYPRTKTTAKLLIVAAIAVRTTVLQGIQMAGGSRQPSRLKSVKQIL